MTTARAMPLSVAACLAGSALAYFYLQRRRRQRKPPQAEPDAAAAAESIVAALKRYQPDTVPEMDPSLHYMAPHVPKVQWTALGDLVASRERLTAGSIPGERWISLRLDGSNFSKTVKALRRSGVLEDGHSARFAEAMQASLRALMVDTSAALGYTQSDEMVVFIPPTSIIRGERQPHLRNGRVGKLSTLAAGLVTARFLLALAQQPEGGGDVLASLTRALPHFDCRAASWESWEEAQSLLIWRAYDCSVNGVSDAVHHLKGMPSRNEVQRKGRRDKVEWLWRQGLLPLPRHQAYGTVLARAKRVVDGHNPKTDTVVRTLRGVIEPVPGPVLELVRADRLWPTDEELAPSA